MYQEQLTLNLVPNFRNTDPLSSAEAGDAVECSGKAAKQRNKALKIVKNHPGHTSKELSKISGMDRYALARRLPELLRANLVTRTKSGECKWFPVP